MQARGDILNFYNFDPVGGIGIDAGPARCNPLVWIVRLRDMLAPEFFNKLIRSWFRMHYQFIMANDMRAPISSIVPACTAVTASGAPGDCVGGCLKEPFRIAVCVSMARALHCMRHW